MMQIKAYLNKQGSLLLQKPVYAWCMTGILALFPLTGWLSLAIVALLTLRRDWLDGVRCLIVGLTVSICSAEVIGHLQNCLDTVVPAYLLCYSGAYLLRWTESWQLIAIFCVSLGVAVILGVHWFAVDFLMEQYQTLLQVLNTIDQEHLISQIFTHQSLSSQLKLAHYLFGLKIVSVILSGMASLMLARSIQAALYYPGGFKKEMMNFRANSMGCLLLLLTTFGAYQNDLLSIGCLPIFFVYLMMAGISLSLSLLAKKKRVVVYATLFLPLLIMPYVALPIYVLFGSIDSLFNLRLRWCLQNYNS